MSTDHVAGRPRGPAAERGARSSPPCWAPLHNVVHLGIGAGLVIAYLAGRKAVGIVATFDHALHLRSAAVLLAAGINARRAARAAA